MGWFLFLTLTWILYMCSPVMALLVRLVQILLLLDGSLEFLLATAGTDFGYCGSVFSCELDSLNNARRVFIATSMVTFSGF